MAGKDEKLGLLEGLRARWDAWWESVSVQQQALLLAGLVLVGIVMLAAGWTLLR